MSAAIEEIEKLVSRYLRNWEDSDMLPSEAAHELVTLILQCDRLRDAMQPISKSSVSVVEAINGTIQVSHPAVDSPVGLMLERGGLFCGLVLSPAQARQLAQLLH